mmetsp:Transcript_51253/g.116751  ORF Transcript_51253/g.116751 Transcript_51253/m.116751 type:complete len:99 (+) Transcript_51253:93-389(+)
MSAVPASWKDVNDFDWKPQAQGLYDPSFERDSCGVGLITSIDGTVDRSIVTDALKILDSLYHRGGRGCEENTGDGAQVFRVGVTSESVSARTVPCLVL